MELYSQGSVDKIATLISHQAATEANHPVAGCRAQNNAPEVRLRMEVISFLGFEVAHFPPPKKEKNKKVATSL